MTLDEQMRTVLIGGLSHQDLLNRLSESGVFLNDHARTLLAAADTQASWRKETFPIVERSVRELGLPQGGTLPDIFDRAQADSLCLCPPTTAAFVRLVTLDQAPAPDNVLRSGRAPSGSLTFAAARLRDEFDFPAGLYLRVIDGRPWLRGYTCDDEHVWSASDTFAFRAAD